LVAESLVFVAVVMTLGEQVREEVAEDFVWMLAAGVVAVE
jgi:hypothetical protein